MNFKVTLFITTDSLTHVTSLSQVKNVKIQENSEKIRDPWGTFRYPLQPVFRFLKKIRGPLKSQKMSKLPAYSRRFPPRLVNLT